MKDIKIKIPKSGIKLEFLNCGKFGWRVNLYGHTGYLYMMKKDKEPLWIDSIKNILGNYRRMKND